MQKKKEPQDTISHELSPGDTLGSLSLKYSCKTWFRRIMPAVFELSSLSFGRFNKFLYLTLLGRLLIPSIYRSIRIYILGSVPDEGAINVVSQLVWVGIIMEVMEEGLLLPLYHCFGQNVRQNDKLLRQKVRSGFYVCLAFYGVFCVVIAVFTPQLIQIMGLKTELGPETTKYIRLELCGIFVSGMTKLFGIVLVLKGKALYLNIILALQLICAVVSDIFFFSTLSFSLKLGTKGVAYSSILQAIVSSLATFILVQRTIGISFRQFFAARRTDYAWMKLWGSQGFYSGLDSLMRNSVYLVVVIRAMNLLDEQDLYWIANNFVWSWLLLPVLALTELLKQDIATNHPRAGFKLIFPAYVCIAVLIVVGWLATSPGWYWFIADVLNAKKRKPDVIVKLVYQLMAGYVFYIISTFNSSIFYAKGKIHYLCLSAFIASCFQVSLFLFVIFQVFPSTLQVIAGLFSATIVFGSAVSSLMLQEMLRRRRRVVEEEEVAAPHYYVVRENATAITGLDEKSVLRNKYTS